MSKEFKNDNIICVDIQPEYSSNFKFDPFDFGDFLNQNALNNNLYLLYNGQDLGMTDETSYKQWLITKKRTRKPMPLGMG